MHSEQVNQSGEEELWNIASGFIDVSELTVAERCHICAGVRYEMEALCSIASDARRRAECESVTQPRATVRGTGARVGSAG